MSLRVSNLYDTLTLDDRQAVASAAYAISLRERHRGNNRTKHLKCIVSLYMAISDIVMNELTASIQTK